MMAWLIDHLAVSVALLILASVVVAWLRARRRVRPSSLAPMSQAWRQAKERFRR